MSRARALLGPAGVTLVELMVSMAVSLLLCGAVFALLAASRAAAASNDEVNDLQQRLRAGLHAVADELAGAGAGLDRTPVAGPLLRTLPAVVPYRRGQLGDDARAGITFRPDVLSLAYVASTQAQAEVARAVDLGGSLRVELRPNCGSPAPSTVCGFEEGMRVILLEPSGAHDFLTVEGVTGPELDLSYRGPLSSTYDGGVAALAHVALHTYALRPDLTTGVPQLAHYDGFLTERPLVDHVVGLSFEYFGAADPPLLRSGAEPEENCTLTVVDGRGEPRLGALGAPGSVVPLPRSLFEDGPWCPTDASPRRFDADLLRVRRVRVRMRAEVAARAMRGAAGTLFTRAGAASAARAAAPDQEAVVDVTLRNAPWRR
jgi:hypothetical protein